MTPTNKKWEPCSPGVIQETATVSLGRRAILKLVGGSAILVALAGGTAVGLFLSDATATPEPSGMSCLAVQDHLLHYTQGKVSNDLEKVIHTHVMQCRNCKKVYNEMVKCPSRSKKPVFKAPCANRCPCP